MIFKHIKMKKLILTAAIGFFGTIAFGQTNFNEVKVDSYYKSDGTFVQEHYRTAPDNSFKIYNWEIIRNSVERRYYGIIQTKKGDILPLIDVSGEVIRGAEDSVFSNSRWYGNMYYNMLMKPVDGKNLYFLFGWNGNSMNSERKIVDAFYIDDRGQAVFGAPVFSVLDRGKRKKTNRLVIEYEKGAKVSMNYDTETKQIIFDHCESQIGDPAKKYTYIPDGTYDGLEWDGNQWVMHENVVQITILKDGEAPLDKAITK